MVYSNVLEALGNTPMIRLQKMIAADMAEILVKFEAVNVGGSIKTRTALNMIKDAEEKGIIKRLYEFIIFRFICFNYRFIYVY